MGYPTEADKIEKQLVELKEWISKEPQIAKDMDDKLLKRFLHSCYYDMPNTQKAVVAFSTMRANSPELFGDRDPMGPRMQQAFKFTHVAFLPICDNRRLWIIQINDPGLQNFEHPEFIRTVLLAFDAWLLEESNLQEGDVTLFDARDVSLKIFWKMHLGLQKKLMKYQEEALPIRIKEMHLINAPSFMDRLFSIMKPFISNEISNLIHFHQPNSDTLFQYFSKDELPKELGGNLEGLEVHKQKIIDLIQKHSETLMNENLWKSPK